jgi:sensor histidine kinase YesM
MGEEFNLTVSFISTLLFTICFGSYVGLVYLNLEVFVPNFFYKKHYLLYFTGIIIATSALNAVTYFIAYPIISINHIDLNFLHWFFYNLYFSFSLIIISSFLHFIKEWSVVNEKNLVAQKEKISAELEALKAQMNPHLLFNALNNIYSLSLEKSDKVPGLILKLSDLMNYVLYECKSDFVPLAKEIEFIKSYIELEKIRFDKSVEIRSIFDADYGSFNIAPLLLLPFIDNAFKHSHTIEKKRKISLSLKIDDKNMMNFEIENSFDPYYSKSKEKAGIGISNVMKRLEYLYPGKYNVKIYPGENTYKVKLAIDLK